MLHPLALPSGHGNSPRLWEGLIQTQNITPESQHSTEGNTCAFTLIPQMFSKSGSWASCRRYKGAKGCSRGALSLVYRGKRVGQKTPQMATKPLESEELLEGAVIGQLTGDGSVLSVSS